MAEESQEIVNPPADWVKPPPEGYFWQTQRPLNSLVFLLPAILYFHICALFWTSNLQVPDLISRAMNFWGKPTTILPGFIVVTVLLFQQAIHRFGWSVNWRVIAGMFVESILWNIPLIAVGNLIAWAMRASIMESNIFGKFAQACGAGIYEEFAFRLIMISLILFFMSDVLKLPHGRSAIVAVIFSAVTFSACHFISGTYAFSWSTFLFLASGGLIWSCLYLFRGFGIAAGAHILWDVYCHLAQM